MTWLQANRYWVLLGVFVACEIARRQGYDTFLLAANQDVLLIAVLAGNFRALTWRTWLAVAFALAVVLMHSSALGIPPAIGLFGARGLVYIVATTEVLSRRADPTQHLRSATPLLGITSFTLVLALVQLVTGFRYDDQDYYNAATIGPYDDSIRLPSMFYNFATFAKFCVCSAIVAASQMSSALSRGEPLARLLSWVLVLAAALTAVVLSGQRAGFLAIVCIGGWLLLRHASVRAALGGVVVVSTALWVVSTYAPTYGFRSMTVFTRDSPDRIQVMVIDSIPRALQAIPSWTGYGMGRSTAAAIRYDYQYGTQWAITDYSRISWEGNEGAMHSALQNGGIPWFLATLFALGWALFRPGLISRVWLIVFGVWSLAHDIWGSSQHYLLMLLLALAVRDQRPMSAESSVVSLLSRVAPKPTAR